MRNLRLLRISLGLSQQKLAECLGISQVRIHSYETGAYEPDISTIVRMADFFNTSIDCLVGRSDEKETASISDSRLNEMERQLIKTCKNLSQTQLRCLCDFLETLDLK